MATQSIKKNIVIHDQSSASAFIEALEKASALASRMPVSDLRIRELKGSKNVKAVFGEKL